MKNVTLTLSIAATALFTLPTTSISADEKKPERKRPEGATRPGGGRMNPEERLKKLTEQLSLTQEQQDKVKAIFEGAREEMAKLRETPEDQRREKFGAFMKAQNEKVLAVLTPEQQEKHKAAMAERAKQGGDRKPGDRKPGDRKPGEGEGKPGDKKPEAK